MPLLPFPHVPTVEGVGAGTVEGVGAGPDKQILALKPPLRGVHLSLPSFEYVELQHPFMHWEDDEQNAQSPSKEGVGVVPEQWSAVTPHLLV